MLNELIGILLGCVHEYVDPEFIPLVDAIFTPCAVGVILICVCVLCARSLTALAHVVTANYTK